MQNILRILYSIITVALLFTITHAQQNSDNVKLAQTGMQFLSVVSDARAAALGNSVTTLPMGSASLFFNPATMVDSKFMDVSISINQWIADIQHNTLSFSMKPGDGDYGVFGVSFQSVDYGEIIGTIVDNSRDQGYTEFSELGLANPKPTGMSLGIGYAVALNTQFSVGGQVRYVHQSLGQSIVRNDTIKSKIQFDTTSQKFKDSLIVRSIVDNKKSPIVLDFGTSFKMGYKSLTLGMSIRNFSTEQKFAKETFELPLTFNVGLSMDVMDFFDDKSLITSAIVAVDAVHNRDYHEQVFIGTEINVMKAIALRCGYVTSSDENDISFGFGVTQFGLVFDYSYTPYGVFDKVQRLSLRFSM